MANVTFGRNAPTAYDIRMERLRAQAGPAPSAPAGKAVSARPGIRIGEVGNLLGTIGTASVLAPVLEAGANAWAGFRKTPQGQLFTDRVGEALSAPANFVNSLLGGNNPLPSFSWRRPTQLTQYNPPGFNPNQPVTGADLLRSAQAVKKYFPQENINNNAIADRNYEAEKNRIAQQAANNPLFQKYQVADLTKQYNEAKTPEQRQSIGLQIWAQTNPQLAAKLKQGQVGYAESQSAPGMSNAGGNLFSSLPMPSANFSTALSMEPPVTMNQPYSTSLPGVNMVSYNPMAFDTQTNADMYKNPIDMGKIMAGAALNTDPRTMNITQDQRRALINQYNQGLINRPFPPAAK